MGTEGLLFFYQLAPKDTGKEIYSNLGHAKVNMESVNLETRVLIYSGSMVDDDELYAKLRFENWQEDDIMGPDCHLCGKEILPLGEFIDQDDDQFDKFEIYWRGDTDEKTEESGVLQCSYCFNYFHRHKCSLSMSDDSVLASYFKKSWACALCVPEFIPTPQTLLRCIFNNKDTDKILQKLFKILNKFNKFNNMLIINSAIELISVKMIEFFDANLFEIG